MYPRAVWSRLTAHRRVASAARLTSVALALTVLGGWSCSAGPALRPAPAPSPAPAQSPAPALTPASAAAPAYVSAAGELPLNIVLVIGDGMGLTQISAGMYASGDRIALERMGVVGLHKSYSDDNLVTDSAAGATAFSCGVKTYNGAIGVRPDGSACPTLLEEAHGRGMPTGLVVTSTIVHATPAAFYAHEASRQSYENIAAQLADSDVDFFVGGGYKFFADRVSDDRDLIAEMRRGGRRVESYFETAFAEASAPDGARYGYLSAVEDPLPAAQGRDYLSSASALALDYLEARDTAGRGFFLMVEGSQIDWGGHANDGAYIVSEVQDLSRTLDVVIDWAAARGNTLVVVTADHETGGFAINNGSTREELVFAFTSDYHTGTLIPVFAAGPGAETFAGIYENTAIYDKLKASLDARSRLPSRSEDGQ